MAFTGLRDTLVRAPILSFPTEDGDYILDTDASNFGLGGDLSQIQDNVERVIAYCSRALRPSQRKYCTTKRAMLAAVSMCILFCSYLRGAKFTLRTDHKSLVWLHRLGGYIHYNSSSFLSYIVQAVSTETLMGFQGHRLRHANSYSPRLPNGGHDSGIVGPTI